MGKTRASLPEIPVFCHCNVAEIRSPVPPSISNVLSGTRIPPFFSKLGGLLVSSRVTGQQSNTQK